jgi:hypothetical protein
MRECFSQRNDPNRFSIGFGEYHNYDPPIEHSSADPSIFTIVFTKIDVNYHRRVKNPIRIGKIEAMLVKINLVF